MNDIIANYLATWNETDPAARRALLEAHWSADASYRDPLVQVSGHDQLDAVIEGVHQQFAGFVFTAYGPSDAHHNQLRFGWALGPAGVEPPVLGFDVLVTDDDGRIVSVLGFLDRVPG